MPAAQALKSDTLHFTYLGIGRLRDNEAYQSMSLWRVKRLKVQEENRANCCDGGHTQPIPNGL